MDLDAIRKLIDTLIETNVAEFELQEGEYRIRVKRAGDFQPAPAAAPAPPAAAPAAAAPPLPAPPADEAGLITVRSPIVGTYYESPSPGAPEFVRTGDAVEVGQVLCIIEAMKLMNEIEAEVAGEVVRKLVTNSQPVEYGQALLLLRPR